MHPSGSRGIGGCSSPTGLTMPRPPTARLRGDVEISQVPGESPCTRAPLIDPGRADIVRSVATTSVLSSVLPSTSTPTIIPLSRLDHAAHALAVYASQPGSPLHHARLASGWWTTLAGRAWLPAGLRSRFQFIHSPPPGWLGAPEVRNHGTRARSGKKGVRPAACSGSGIATAPRRGRGAVAGSGSGSSGHGFEERAGRWRGRGPAGHVSRTQRARASARARALFDVRASVSGPALRSNACPPRHHVNRKTVRCDSPQR